MQKSVLRKPLSVLLSLLMALSVCGGMVFPAHAADAETYQIILQGNVENFADFVTVTASPSAKARPAIDSAMTSANRMDRSLLVIFSGFAHSFFAAG